MTILTETFAPALSSRVSAASLPVQRRRREAAADLADALSARIAGEVRFDPASRALYATDLSIYRQVPIGVVIPKDEADVEATVEACRARDVPILGRGCGTSLSGQTCNVAVFIDFSKYMNRILAVDPDARRARVQPGVINDEVRKAAAQKHGLTYAPDPATHAYCTLGGNIGNNSCGAHTVMGDKTVDNVEELDILTYDGLRMRVGATDKETFDLICSSGGRRAEIYSRLKELADRYADEIRRRYPKIPRRVSGYNLDDLLPEKGFHIARSLVGSEGTCALTLSATLRLLPWPPKRALLVLGYPDIARAADDVGELRSLGPDALEAFDGHIVENMKCSVVKEINLAFVPEAQVGEYVLVHVGFALTVIDESEAAQISSICARWANYWTLKRAVLGRGSREVPRRIPRPRRGPQVCRGHLTQRDASMDLDGGLRRPDPRDRPVRH